MFKPSSSNLNSNITPRKEIFQELLLYFIVTPYAFEYLYYNENPNSKGRSALRCISIVVSHC